MTTQATIASPLFRVDRAPQERYPTAEDFLAAVDRYWGVRGHLTAPDATVHFAACPRCRSRSRPEGDSWLRWPLLVWAHDGPRRWGLLATCGCRPAAIVATLINAERAALDLEVIELEAPA